jgi:hypothetical protein
MKGDRLIMKKAAKPCIIACGIFKKELERLVEEKAFDADLHFLDPGLHNDPRRLGQVLKGALEKRSKQYPKGVIVAYGDICMGFNHEIKGLVEEYGAAKIDALNGIDALLGGKGKLLEIDPEHAYFFINDAWIDLEFADRTTTKEQTREEFSVLKGLYLLDTLGDLDSRMKEIEAICDLTGLPTIERQNIGLEGLKSVILEAFAKSGSRRPL